VQFDTAMLTAENQVLNAPRYQKERRVVVEFLHRLHTARTAHDYFSLQFDLLAHFGAHQALVDDDLKRMEREAREELGRLVREAPKPISEIRAQQARLEAAQRERKVSNALLHVFRVIGDGIAWLVPPGSSGCAVDCGVGSRPSACSWATFEQPR
jgi:hypothetical protein